MRILVVSPYAPWPLHGGTPVRMYNLSRTLAGLGHELHLLHGRDEDEAPLPTHVEKLFARVETFDRPRMSARKAALLSLASTRLYPAHRYAPSSYVAKLKGLLAHERYDAAFVNFLFMLHAFQGAPRGAARIAYEQHESERAVWQAYLRSGSPPERLLAAANLAKLPRELRRALPLVDLGVCVSADEAAQLQRQLVPPARAVELPNGVDVDLFAPSRRASEGSTIVLCASMGVRRNIDAATWFAREVFPLVRKGVPSARFVIVGSHPSPEVKALADEPGIEVTGTVEDVVPHLDRARVIIAPYRYGAGTKLKVVEGMSMARPIVSTSVGAFGLQLTHGVDALLADDAVSFADGVLRALTDDALADTLGAAARERACARHSWSKIGTDLDGMLRALVEERQ